MDILTPKGQKTVREEDEAVALFESKYHEYMYARTPKDRPCPVDAVITNATGVSGVVECKCRQMTLATLSTVFNWEWLVTGAKLTDGIAVAKALGVPFVGFLYLVPDKRLLIQKIWEPDAGYAVPIRWQETETQATVNGGLAKRVNAFISMKQANILEP